MLSKSWCRRPAPTLRRLHSGGTNTPAPSSTPQRPLRAGKEKEEEAAVYEVAAEAAPAPRRDEKEKEKGRRRR